MRDAAGADVSVLVVGGGPSGALTGLLLARRGWEVELVDRARFPRGKACGECVNPAAVRLLRSLGLPECLRASRATPLNGWELGPAGGRPARAVFAGGDVALGIERGSFDHALLGAARDAGVRVREGVRLLEAVPGSATRPALARLRLAGGGEELRCARLLVGADGLRSRVGAALDAGPVVPPRKASLSWRITGRGPSRDRGRLALDAGATVGLAPVGPSDGTLWNATLVVTPDARSAIGRPLAAAGWDLLRDRLPDGDWSEPPRVVDGPWGSGSFHRPVRRPARGRTLLVGDAAGYFDPLTGQGIHRALRSAHLAAAAVDRHLPGGRQRALREADVVVAKTYVRALRRALAPGRRLQHTIEAVLSRDGSRRLALGLLRRAPPLASGLVRCVGGRPTTFFAPPAADPERPRGPTGNLRSSGG